MNPEIIKYTERYNAVTHGGGKAITGSLSCPLKRIYLEVVGYKRGMSVLDYGCGYGSFLEVVNDYSEYTGVDISPYMVELAKELNPLHEFHVSEIGKTRVEKKDFIIARSVFTHVPKSIVGEALSDIRENLKEDGVAMIDVSLEGMNEGLYVSYEHREWLETLEANGLQGEHIFEQVRTDLFIHHYYKICHK